MNQDGSLYLEPIRTAKVNDIYILKGVGEEVWEPRFTYHGFQYVEITGFPGKPNLSHFTGMVVHDALEATGTFTTSNKIINDIYNNARWGIKGNYRSIPTDCLKETNVKAGLAIGLPVPEGKVICLTMLIFIVNGSRIFRIAKKSQEVSRCCSNVLANLQRQCHMASGIYNYR